LHVIIKDEHRQAGRFIGSHTALAVLTDTAGTQQLQQEWKRRERSGDDSDD